MPEEHPKRVTWLRVVVFVALSPAVIWLSFRIWVTANQVISDLKRKRSHQQQRQHATSSGGSQNLSALDVMLDRVTAKMFSASWQMRLHQLVVITQCIVYFLQVVGALLLSTSVLSQQSFAYQSISLLVFLSFALSYLCMLFIFAARCVVTFSASGARSRRWGLAVSRTLWKIITVAFLIWLLGFVAFVARFRVIAALSSTLILLIYFGLCVFLTVKFFNEAVRVAKQVTSLEFDVDDNGDDVEVETGGANKDLCDSALRVTLCAAMSLSSNCIVLILMIAALLDCFDCNRWYITASFMVCVDIVLNMSCLLGSFRDGQRYYFAVLRRLHDKLKQFVITW